MDDIKLNTQETLTYQKEYISKQINNILNENIVCDLKKNLCIRSCLNKFNIGLIYIFHLLQTCGLIATTLSSTYNLNYLLWIGITCNSTASLIIIYEKVNENISNTLLVDINLIKDGKYVDESSIEINESKL
jgi:hypothetical protein